MRRIVVLAVVACGRIGFGPSGATTDGGLAPCTTSICECDVDGDCTDAHTYCSAHDGEHTCECVAGYGRAARGAACAWVGVVTDPGFQDPTAWTTTDTIDPSASGGGMADPGVAKLAMLERVGQTIAMPRRAAAEPLFVQMSFKGGAFGAGTTTPMFGIATKWLQLIRSSPGGRCRRRSRSSRRVARATYPCPRSIC